MDKNGQIWVETVIYLLIGISLIGLTLAFVVPKINAQKDRLIVEQTIISLNKLEQGVREIAEKSEGNRRILNFNIKLGELKIDSENNELKFYLEGLSEPYSEPGVEIPVGRVILYSEQKQKSSSVELKIQFNGVNLLYDGVETDETFPKAQTDYRFSIENNGLEIINEERVVVINIKRI